jgi:hypothetical protein
MVKEVFYKAYEKLKKMKFEDFFDKNVKKYF